MLVPVTEAVSCTVLGVVAVLTGTDVEVVAFTVTTICDCPPPPPLPGACAIHAASGRMAASATRFRIKPVPRVLEVSTEASEA